MMPIRIHISCVKKTAQYVKRLSLLFIKSRENTKMNFEQPGHKPFQKNSFHDHKIRNKICTPRSAKAVSVQVINMITRRQTKQNGRLSRFRFRSVNFRRCGTWAVLFHKLLKINYRNRQTSFFSIIYLKLYVYNKIVYVDNPTNQCKEKGRFYKKKIQLHHGRSICSFSKTLFYGSLLRE